jgi:hypothetical protein
VLFVSNKKDPKLPTQTHNPKSQLLPTFNRSRKNPTTLIMTIMERRRRRKRRFKLKLSVGTPVYVRLPVRQFPNHLESFGSLVEVLQK